MIILSPSNAISIFINAFCMSNVITYFFCFASITPVVIMASDAAVGLVASSHKIYACYVLPLAHILTLMVFSLFLFNKIILSLSIFLSRFAISLMLIGF